jgi:endonuclease YncB( thermonuclease family)
LTKAILFILCAVFVATAQSQYSAAGRPGAKTVVLYDQMVDGIALLEGNVVLVNKGDEISLATRDGLIYAVHLQGIEAPGKSQPFGIEAARQLAVMVQGMDVTVAVRNKPDADGRYTGSVYLDGQDIGLWLLTKGLARNTPRDGQISDVAQAKYSDAEQKARTDRIGLWKDDKAISPQATDAGTTATARSPKNGGKTPISPTPKNVVAETRTYTLGPRGGCYYINPQGSKVYVDKGLCNKTVSKAVQP